MSDFVEINNYIIDLEQIKFVRVDGEKQIVIFYSKEMFVPLHDENAVKFLKLMRKRSKQIDKLLMPTIAKGF